jgi:hypothetical protein
VSLWRRLQRPRVSSFGQIRLRFGRIDIFVKNTGIGSGSFVDIVGNAPLKFWETTPDQWRRFVAVHTTAPLALANAVVPDMMRQGRGRIVIIGKRERAKYVRVGQVSGPVPQCMRLPRLRLLRQRLIRLSVPDGELSSCFIARASLQSPRRCRETPSVSGCIALFSMRPSCIRKYPAPYLAARTDERVIVLAPRGVGSRSH